MAKDEIVILYGSQTGQAETIAENIHEAADEHDIKSTLICLREAEKAFEIVSSGNSPLVFLCSTTGDGELPGNARKFFRMIQRRTLESDHLSRLKYALLGLGDSNYSTFCGGPKKLERALKKLGASCFYTTGFADDGTDMEIVVEPWIEGLWPALKSHIRSVKNSCDEITLQKNQQELDTILSKQFKSDLVITSLSVKDGVMTKNKTLPQEKVLEMETESRIALDLSGDSDSKLLPVQQSYLTYKLMGEKVDVDLPATPIIPYPLAINDSFYNAPIIGATQLTSDDSIKKALCVSLKVPPVFLYEPGDSFGVFVQNPKLEVDWLLERLKVTDLSDKPLKIEISTDTKKKNAKVPNFIPTICTMRYILEYCLEIRAVPKRTFLRVLHDYATSEKDKNVLQRLCCKDGMSDYIKYVREPHLNILDILASVPSCQPPFEVLLEHLPRLRARLYSAASCQKICRDQLRFVFNVVDLEPQEGRMYYREGLCTGTLQEMAENLRKTKIKPENALVTKNNDLQPSLIIFKTKNDSFKLPDNPTAPIIMVGPGTGIAPFIGFLESLRYQKFKMGGCPETWMFYGCRHEKRDFLFQKELKYFVEDGTLRHLVVCFSRDKAPKEELNDARPKYVQDNLVVNAEAVYELLTNQNATLYVCGDARNMAKEVKETIIGIFSQKMERDVAVEMVKKIVQDGRYKEDVW